MSSNTAATGDVGPWRAELIDVVRALSGGLLFGIPLLYTMEAWWIGSHTRPAQALVVLLLSSVPVFLLNRTSGFRSSRDVRLRDAVTDTIEAIGLGLILSAVVLVLLRELTLQTPLRRAVGEIVYEAVPFCLGIGVARHFLHGQRDDDDDGDDTDAGAGAPADDTEAGAGAPADDRTATHAVVADVGATVIGAVFVGLSIAPTDEVPTLASGMRPAWLLVVIAASLTVSYAIVFVAGFVRQDRRTTQPGPFQRPATETVLCYLVALGCSAFMLWFYRRADGPWQVTLAHTIVLALPAAVGGAAGRLAI